MEHRYSNRSTAELGIIIYQKNIRVAIGTIKNISEDGFFAATGLTDVLANQPLEIEFLSAELDSAFNRRLPAMVVHSNEDGFGAEIDRSAISNAYSQTAYSPSTAKFA
ncbi:MAG TPA: PilZ domain-containing protein [Spongiibacteraceae bacterium]|nr:PilZ domain-containing protein [Spongiibacteraceae bacterium]